MGNRRSLSDKWTDGFIISIMLGLVFITAYPIFYVILASFSDGTLLMQHTGFLYKSFGFHIDAYLKVFDNANILIGYGNTLFVVVASLVVSLSITAMTAYVLSRKQVYWNQTFIFIIVLTMFFNGGLIPFYLVVKGVGLMNSLWALIIPFAVNTFNLIIMRTAFMSVPDSLEESAKIDGANHFTIFFRIVIPLSLPVIAVMSLYYAVEKWNGWFYASLFLKDRQLFPLQLILREILISNSTDSMLGGGNLDTQVEFSETIKYATIVVATLPILCIYPFVQKYFVKGVMVGALKG
ncbi:carbohydrate ABC transporter permease [Paenibacillus agricola]|uniref:Carbohydrate ABC transporter permease n=1 Tax=Paenibacillus agricola TaxID=2716264 RepID=A0ABX0J2N7_9BACL|nr:carbohydrate ABC transporter permease [Paenibacillus agricola]NHN30407.1 carbohydrate ABC transporter permease [Paenibacillus agricola]